MKIVQLVPGSGGSFYCENCLRDAALVRALRQAGHEILMVPMYLPLAAGQGRELANAPVFFGGINVYLQQRLRLFRRTPRWLDRLFDSPRLLRWAAARAGATDAAELGETTLSMLRGERGRQVKELDKLIGYLSDSGSPDVLCLSNALLLGLARRIKAELDVPVVCMLQDEDIFLDALPDSHRGPAWRAVAEGARDADLFVAVSRYYSGAMIDRLGLPADRVVVVYTGVDAEGRAPADQPPGQRTIGFLDRMCRDKGLDVLIEAFLMLKSKRAFGDVRLRVAGGKLPVDEPFLARCRKRIAAAGQTRCVEFLGSFEAASRLAFLRSLSVLAAPSRHKEAFGLCVLESLAEGVPVVLPPEGAFPELIEATGGGVLCQRNDAASLAAGIEQLLTDRDVARRLGRRGRQAVLEKFTVRRMAGEFVQACQRACGNYRAGDAPPQD